MANLILIKAQMVPFFLASGNLFNLVPGSFGYDSGTLIPSFLVPGSSCTFFFFGPRSGISHFFKKPPSLLMGK